jgi:hypothetical protein
VGLNLNIKKTKVMSTVDKVNFFSDHEDISTVTKTFLVVITNEEIKKRISWSKTAMANLTNTINKIGSFNQHKSQATADKSLSSGAGWVKREADKKTLMKPWTVSRMNEAVTNQDMPKCSLETLATTSKLRLFGHAIHSSVCMKQDLILGLTYGKGK